GNDPEKDFHYMVSKMAENGWDRTRIDRLFDENAQLIMDTYNGHRNGKWDHTAPQYGPQNAGADVFLYYMTEKEHLLSGIDIKEFIDDDKMYDEYWIKF